MKFFWGLLLSISLLSLSSCRDSYTQDKAGMEKLNTDLKTEFGNDAWYSTISYTSSPDNDKVYIVSVDETKDPNIPTQTRWIKQGSDWEKLANVNLSIRNGEPKDYMFQLDKNNISLAKLGELITQTKQTVEKQLNIKNTLLKIAILATNNIVLAEEGRFTYTIILKNPSSDETYSYTYKLDGSLQNKNP